MGFKRIFKDFAEKFLKTNTRITLNKKIIPIIIKNSKGKILDIGARNSPYKKYMNYASYSILDINKDNPNVNYIEDLHKTTLPSETFDTIIMTEVLEHLYNPQLAINQVHRILKENGKVIASTRFIYPYHGDPNDYFRFTEYGIRALFKDFSKVRVITHGNVFLGISDLLTNNLFFRIFRIFNPLLSIFDKKENIKNPLGFVILVEK